MIIMIIIIITIRNKTQTAVINMAIKRMLENKVYYLTFLVFRHTSSKVTLSRIELTTKFNFKISN